MKGLNCKAVISVLGLIIVAFNELALAAGSEVQQSFSWNLSRDMITNMSTNPTTPTPPATGVWSFMENKSGYRNPPTSVSYTLLPTYSAPCLGAFTPFAFNYWDDISTPLSLPVIGLSSYDTVNFNNNFSNFDVIQGVPVLHPDGASQVVLKWTSPVSGIVRLLGRISDIDNKCGDGVAWRIRRKSNSPFLSNLTAWHYLGNGGAETFMVSSRVMLGTELYFIIDKNQSVWCDSTALDILITTI